MTQSDEQDLSLKTGPELLELIAQYPTLDEVLDRDPKTITREQWIDQIKRARLERALFAVRESEKRAKKRGEDNGE